MALAEKTPMLQSVAFEDLKDFVNMRIAYARVKIDGVFTQVPIERRERLKNGKQALYFSVTPQANHDVTITEVQLYNTNSDLWLKKAENIPIKAVQEGVLYRFTFDFKEVQDNV